MSTANAPPAVTWTIKRQTATTAQPVRISNCAYGTSARFQDSDWLILQNMMESIEHLESEAIGKLLDACHASDGQTLQ
jgi:hypothetical protein